jgi:hypothetical protein
LFSSIYISLNLFLHYNQWYLLKSNSSCLCWNDNVCSQLFNFIIIFNWENNKVLWLFTLFRSNILLTVIVTYDFEDILRNLNVIPFPFQIVVRRAKISSSTWKKYIKVRCWVLVRFSHLEEVCSIGYTAVRTKVFVDGTY